MDNLQFLGKSQTVLNFFRVYKKIPNPIFSPETAAFSEVGGEPCDLGVPVPNLILPQAGHWPLYCLPHLPLVSRKYRGERIRPFLCIIAVSEAFLETPGHLILYSSLATSPPGLQALLNLIAQLLTSALTSFLPLTIWFISAEASESVSSGRKLRPYSQVLLSYIKNETDSGKGRALCSSWPHGETVSRPPPADLDVKPGLGPSQPTRLSWKQLSFRFHVVCVMHTHKTTSVCVCLCEVWVWNQCRSCPSLVHNVSLKTLNRKIWPGVDKHLLAEKTHLWFLNILNYFFPQVFWSKCKAKSLPGFFLLGHQSS